MTLNLNVTRLAKFRAHFKHLFSTTFSGMKVDQKQGVIKGNSTHKVWPIREADRQKIKIALTFLLFELSESTAPFWNQQGEAPRMVSDLVGLIGFSGCPIFQWFYH